MSKLCKGIWSSIIVLHSYAVECQWKGLSRQVLFRERQRMNKFGNYEVSWLGKRAGTWNSTLKRWDSAHNFGPILKVAAMLQGPPGRRSEPCEKHSNKDTSGQGAIVSTVPHFLPPSFYPLTSKPGWFWGWGSSKTWILHVYIIMATETYELLCNIIPNISICMCFFFVFFFLGGGVTRVFVT